MHPRPQYLSPVTPITSVADRVNTRRSYLVAHSPLRSFIVHRGRQASEAFEVALKPDAWAIMKKLLGVFVAFEPTSFVDRFRIDTLPSIFFFGLVSARCSISRWI